MKFLFGPFCLDTAERVLLREKRVVHIPAKALSTLLVLVRNGNHLVDKNALIEEVWPDEFVEESNLAQQIYVLRRALGDTKDGSQYIETVPRRGYRFLKTVREINDSTNGVPSSVTRRRTGKRFTENSVAYRTYLTGRYYWSKYTTEGLRKAIRWFQNAIFLDPGFAMAYAAVVDCYLRLATNYLLPADGMPETTAKLEALEFDRARSSFLEVRREWDWKAAERECKRAIELESDYPATHQWYAAYVFARGLYEDRSELQPTPELDGSKDGSDLLAEANVLDSIQSARPTSTEEVQVLLVVAREQIEAGNYEAACAVLQRWWTLGKWPELDGLNPHLSADLLFTVGSLATNIVSTRQVPKGQKHAEALLNGSIALFEQLNIKTRSAEGRIELALCYQREGLFDLARSALLAALDELSDEDCDLKSLGLVRLASLERAAGRRHDALARLNEASDVVKTAGPWIIGRYALELASTLKDPAIIEGRNEYSEAAIGNYLEALYQFEAVGHHRLAAIVENNYSLLLLSLDRVDEADGHLMRARRLFDGFGDRVRRAQVDETMTHLFLARQDLEGAEKAIKRSVEALEIGGEDAVLAESLRTQGIVLSKLGRYREAQRILDRAQHVAEHCGDVDGVQRALTIKTEIVDQLSQELKRSRQQLSALEKRVPEGSLVDSLSQEMLKVLANSKLLLDQALGSEGTEPHTSLGMANRRALIEIQEDLKAALDEATLQIVNVKIKTIFTNEERQNEILQRVLTAIDHGLDVTHQVIDYSKLRPNHLGQEIVNINDLVTQVIDEFREEFVGQDIESKHQSDASSVLVTGVPLLDD